MCVYYFTSGYNFVGSWQPWKKMHYRFRAISILGSNLGSAVHFPRVSFTALLISRVELSSQYRLCCDVRSGITVHCTSHPLGVPVYLPAFSYASCRPFGSFLNKLRCSASVKDEGEFLVHWLDGQGEFAWRQSHLFGWGPDWIAVNLRTCSGGCVKYPITFCSFRAWIILLRATPAVTPPLGVGRGWPTSL